MSEVGLTSMEADVILGSINVSLCHKEGGERPLTPELVGDVPGFM